MRGHLGVKSEPGKGSLFWFSVPLLKAVGDLQVRRSLDGIRALALVDDDALLRRLQNAGSTLGIEVTLRALARRRAVGPAREREHGRALAPRRAFRRRGRVQARRPTTLVRNVLKDTALGHVRMLLSGYGGTRSAAGSAPARSGGNITEEVLRTTLEPMFGVQEPGFARAEPPPKRSLQLGPTNAEAPLRGRVLLVEDNAVNQRVAQRLLDLHGLEVTAVNDGREAVGRLEREALRSRADGLPDAGHGRLYGYTSMARARAALPASGHVPIVAMTANAMAGDRERCLASGMDDYLSKPLDRAVLAQMLRRWLPQARCAGSRRP